MEKNLPDQYFYFSRQFLGNFISSKGIICNGIISIFFSLENKDHNYNILAVTGDPTTLHPAVRLGLPATTPNGPLSLLSPRLDSFLVSTLSTCLSLLSPHLDSLHVSLCPLCISTLNVSLYSLLLSSRFSSQLSLSVSTRPSLHLDSPHVLSCIIILSS